MARRSSNITVNVIGDVSKLSSAFSEAESKTGRFSEKMGQLGASLTRNVTLPLVGLGVMAVKAAGEQEVASAKLESTFNSMGAAAWTTVEALNAQAVAFQKTTTFGDEAVTTGQSILLTFGNITNQMGEGNQVFDRTTKIMLDLSAALDQDMKSSAVQLGKALNDPIQGVSALQRVGVSFTQAQKDQIRVMQESGDLMGAQKLILQELERQFGGTAEAIADTATGKMKQAMNSLGDSMEEVGAILLPIIAEAAEKVKELAERFQELDPRVQEATVKVGLFAAALGPVLYSLSLLAKTKVIVVGGFTKLGAAIGWVTGLFKVGSLGVAGWRLALVGALDKVFAFASALSKLFLPLTVVVTAITGLVNTFKLIKEGFRVAGDESAKLSDKLNLLVKAFLPIMHLFPDMEADLKRWVDNWTGASIGTAKAQRNMDDGSHQFAENQRMSAIKVVAASKSMSEETSEHLAKLAKNAREARWNVYSEQEKMVEDARRQVADYLNIFSKAPEQHKVSLDQFRKNLEQKVTDQRRLWAAVLTLQQAGLDDLAQMLLDEGPAAADAAEAFVKDIEEGMAFEAFIDEHTALAGSLPGAMANAIEQNKGTALSIFRQWGIDAKSAIQAGWDSVQLNMTIPQLIDAAPNYNWAPTANQPVQNQWVPQTTTQQAPPATPPRQTTRTGGTTGTTRVTIPRGVQ